MIVLMEGEERERVKRGRERDKAALTGSECGNGEGSRSF